MQRCSHCGRESPSGSIFCLNCGTRLAGSDTGRSTPSDARPLPAGAVACGKCGADNSPGMNFCRNCGARLVARSASTSAPPAPAAPASGPAALAGRMPSAADVVGRKAAPSPSRTCGHCGGTTPGGFRFCQLCGKPLGDERGAADARRAPVPGRDSRPPGVRTGVPVRRADVPDAVAATIAIAGDDARAVVSAAADMARKRTVEEDPAVVATLPETPLEQLRHTPRQPVSAEPPPQPAPAAGPAWGRLVLVRQDGSDGDTFELRGDAVEIGREGAGLRFPGDRHLAPVHARLERRGEGVAIVPIDPVNGVYRRIDARASLRGGDWLLMGREILRFDVVADDERAVVPTVQHGVLRFGSPGREPWGRLSVQLSNGGVRDVRYLSGDRVVVGREEGDIVFSDDEFMSRRHAAIGRTGADCFVEDLGSSNGTYLRMRGAETVRGTAHVRIGDQLFRLEVGP